MSGVVEAREHLKFAKVTGVNRLLDECLVI